MVANVNPEMWDTADLVSIRPAIAELERFSSWYYRTRIGARTSDNGFTLLISSYPKLCGYFGKEKWSGKEGNLIHEMVITSERLRADPLDVLETVAHETLHLANEDMEIKDCSKSGAHNKKFKEACEEYGLVCEKGTKGWNSTSLTPALRRDIEQDFVPDMAAFALFRLLPPAKEPRKSTKSLSCGCTKVRVSLKVDFQATCNKCDSEFKEVEANG